MIYAALLIAANLTGTVPLADVTRESVDAIELNSFYDDQGRLVFQQAIFMDWNNGQRRFDVRAWRLVKHQEQIPQKDYRHGGYVTTWHDGEIIRQVRSNSVQESWTQVDVELLAREVLPKELRRDLRLPPAMRRGLAVR